LIAKGVKAHSKDKKGGRVIIGVAFRGKGLKNLPRFSTHASKGAEEIREVERGVITQVTIPGGEGYTSAHSATLPGEDHL